MNEESSLLWQDTTIMVRTALRSSVAKNAAFLYVIQFANYILPLITVPYLVRVLGPAKYGVVAFGQSLIIYLVLFVEYGFALSATRKISIKRNDPITINRTAFNVWAAKSLLCITGFVTLLLLVTIIPRLHEITVLLLILYGMAVGNVFFPVWLFQGMEKMAYISVINLVMRLFVVISIFMMVHGPEDYLLYAGLISLGSISAGIAGMGIALSMFKLHPVIPSWRGIWEMLVEGWMLFLSTASVSLYSVGNPLILGLLTNNTVVGYYSAGEKVVNAGLGLFGPIMQAAYPKFNKLASQAKLQALLWARRMLVLMGGLGLFLSISMFIGAPLIANIFLGPDYASSVLVIRVLAPLLFLVGLTHVLGIQVMLSFAKDKAFTTILLSAGLINVILATICAPAWQALGMAISFLVSQIFVTIVMIIYCQVNGISPLFRNAKLVRVDHHL